MTAILGVFIAYFLGSFPTSYLVTRWIKGVDIREQGSGNAGATNVYRVVGKLPGAVVLVVDALKGWIPVVLMARWIAGSGDAGVPIDWLKAVYGLVAVCGHIWSPFLGFKGGKGVATATGVLIGLNPLCALFAALIWLITTALSRYVSVGSIVAVASTPLLLVVANQPPSWVIASAVICMIVVYKHKSNIIRLLRHDENRIGSS